MEKGEIILRKIRGDCWQGEILARYDFPFLRQALARIKRLTFSPEARLLREGRNRLVILDLPTSPHETIEVVVKEFRPRGLVKLRSLISGSRARKSFYGALKLKQSNINTPEPVAYIENRNRFSSQTEYFLALRIKEAQEIRFFFQNYPKDEMHSLLYQLAAFVRSMHERGVWHRDLSDGNILVNIEKTGSYDFSLLDPNRVKIKRKIGLWLRIKNLIRLGIPPSHQRFFLEAYFAGEKLLFFYWWWYLFNKKLFILWIKIKKWLRLRAVARCLRLQ